MLENDPDLFLKFAACCKISLAGTIDLHALPRAQQLLEEYLEGFLKVRLSSLCKQLSIDLRYRRIIPIL
jgi:hypothetical protein